jgi:hypothetical protein
VTSAQETYQKWIRGFAPFSAFGIRFAANGPVEPGLKLKVAITWPARSMGESNFN